MIHQLTNFKKRRACVVAVFMDLVCMAYMCQFSKASHFCMTPATCCSSFSVFVEDILNFVSVLFQHCCVREQIYKNAAWETFEHVLECLDLNLYK